MVKRLPAEVTAILWDLDGTIADSEAATMAAVAHALDSCGHHDIELSAHQFIGPPLEESLTSLGFSGADIGRIRDAYRVNFLSRQLDAISAFDGIVPVLQMV